MKRDKIQFSKYVFESEELFNSLPQYKSTVWPESWEVMVINRVHERDCIVIDNQLDEWIAAQAVGQVSYTPVPADMMLVGFEDSDDAMLFKISFDGAVS